MDENLKDIDATIDNFTTYLKLFENNKSINSELAYFHINALCLLSELMNIMNEMYDNIPENTDLFVKKINEIMYDIDYLMYKIENNFKKSYTNTLFYNDMCKVIKDKNDDNAISIKSALDYFAEYNSIKLIKILTNYVLTENISSIMQFLIPQKYFDRIDNIKARITELVKRIKLTVSHETYDARFSFNEEKYKEEMLMLVTDYINRDHFEHKFEKFGNNNGDSIPADNPTILDKPIEVHVDITIKNCDIESIDNLTKENKEKVIKALLSETNDKIMKQINEYKGYIKQYMEDKNEK